VAQASGRPAGLALEQTIGLARLAGLALGQPAGLARLGKQARVE